MEVSGHSGQSWTFLTAYAEAKLKSSGKKHLLVSDHFM
jgi:hypothetical protein